MERETSERSETNVTAENIPSRWQRSPFEVFQAHDEEEARVRLMNRFTQKISQLAERARNSEEAWRDAVEKDLLTIGVNGYREPWMGNIMFNTQNTAHPTNSVILNAIEAVLQQQCGIDLRSGTFDIEELPEAGELKEKVEERLHDNAASPDQALERIARRESYDNATIERFKEQFGGPEHYREIARNIDIPDEVFQHYYASDLLHHTVIALQNQTTDEATAQDPRQTLQDIIDQLDEYGAGFDFPATDVVQELSSSLPIEMTDHALNIYAETPNLVSDGYNLACRPSFVENNDPSTIRERLLCSVLRFATLKADQSYLRDKLDTTTFEQLDEHRDELREWFLYEREKRRENAGYESITHPAMWLFMTMDTAASLRSWESTKRQYRKLHGLFEELKV